VRGVGNVGLSFPAPGPPPSLGEEATDLKAGVDCAETKDKGVGGMAAFLLFVGRPGVEFVEFEEDPVGSRKKLLAPPLLLVL